MTHFPVRGIMCLGLRERDRSMQDGRSAAEDRLTDKIGLTTADHSDRVSVFDDGEWLTY